jgi:hypothetical protein
MQGDSGVLNCTKQEPALAAVMLQATDAGTLLQRQPDQSCVDKPFWGCRDRGERKQWCCMHSCADPPMLGL